MMLDVQNIHTYYGSIHAVKGISLHVDKGEIVTLIGANGAGKTTTLGTICGLLAPKEGKIIYNDEDITGMPGHVVAHKKIAHAPEGREIFPGLTVDENLRLGGRVNKESGREKENFARVFDIFPRLQERHTQIAGTLSGGEQQMLAIGRALMAEPELLLLDEPSLGLAPNLVEMIFNVIQQIKEQGVTVLLVEQNANMALSVADRGYVLETGTIKLEGTGEELLANDEVRRLYLGG